MLILSVLRIIYLTQSRYDFSDLPISVRGAVIVISSRF